MTYEIDMSIDDSALDVECLEQPKLMMKYTAKSAQVKMERDQAKELLDVVRADMDKEIRTNPDKFGIEKLTETVVSNTILTTPAYKTAMKNFLEAKYEADVVAGAVAAIEQRKSMLEALIKLHGQSYFAGPSIPRNLSMEKKMREEQQKKVDSGIATKLKRRN